MHMELKEKADFVKDVVQNLEKAGNEDLCRAYYYAQELTNTEEGIRYLGGIVSRIILPRILVETEKRGIRLVEFSDD